MTMVQLRVKFWDVYGYEPSVELAIAGADDESLRALLLAVLGDDARETVYQLRFQDSWLTVDEPALMGAVKASFGENTLLDVDRGRRGGGGFFIPLSVVLRIGIQAIKFSRQEIIQAAWKSPRDALQSWLRSGKGDVPSVLREYVYSEPRRWEGVLVEQLGQPQAVIIELLLASGYRHYVADEWWNPDVPEAPFNDSRV